MHIGKKCDIFVPYETVVLLHPGTDREANIPCRSTNPQKIIFETILMLSQRMGKVRSIDVVNELGFTKASVSIAMKKLRRTAISRWTARAT